MSQLHLAKWGSAFEAEKRSLGCSSPWQEREFAGGFCRRAGPCPE